MEYSGGGPGDVTSISCDPHMWCRQLALAKGAGIRVIAHAPADTDDEAVAAFASEALPLGYVTLDAHTPLSEDRRRRCWHRHVALIHRGPATPISVRWVRELADASPRGHVVIAIAAQADRVQDAAWPAEPVLDLLPAPGLVTWTARPERLWRRRRLRSARLWTSAAVERARRRTDEGGLAVAFCQLVARSEARSAGDAAALITRGRRLLQCMQSLAARSHVVAALADVWITQGAFEMATSALAAVDVECMLSGVNVPVWIREPQCELACWHGQWEHAGTLARDAGHAGWRAVAAFARRDWPTVKLAASAGAPDPHGGGWPAVLEALCGGVADDGRRVVDALARVRASDDPPRWRDVLMLESLRMAGADDVAREWVRTMAPRPRGPAEVVLWQWAATRSQTNNTGPLEAAVRRLGAEGIRHFGTGRQHMQMWAGVSSLLQQFHEIDDAGAALRKGCRWAREYTGVDGVGIVSHDGAVVACDPDDRPRGSWVDGPAQAVRYGGVRIGDVVLRGDARDDAEARAVAMALASACAPALRARLDDLSFSRAGDAIAGELLGVSAAMRALRDAVARAALSTFPVLIEGESGTGKELVARAVHRLSARRDRRWAAVNCAALTDELFEAELFGHARGAFTGAVGQRIGLLEDAHEGTLFLDEVAELSPRAQAKLLRVLQEGEIRRVGENGSRRVDVRVVAATNRSLAEAAGQGRYREDLVFRLAVIRLRMPPLRERIEDVPILAQAFWRAAATRVSTRALLAPDAVGALCRFSWPGNVRELQNVIATLAVSGPTRGRISARHVSHVLADRTSREPGHPPLSLAAARALSDRRLVAAALARHANQRTAAARELGVSRQGLAKLIARLDLAPGPIVPADSAAVVASRGLFR